VEISGNKPNYSKFVFPSFVFILNVLIKISFIQSRDLALDEPFSIYYGQMDLKSIVEMLYNENNPPLHFFILHFFIKFFGIGTFSVRLPSLIFSAFTAVVIFRIGNKFFSQLTGITASLIFTFSTMHIFFSHEARAYPLFCLLTASSLYFFLSIVQNPSNKRNFIWLFICNLLLIYSHYFGFFVLFIEVFSLLITENRKLIWKRMFLMMALVMICYIPMLVIFLHRLGVSTGNGTWVAKPDITELYGNLNRFLNDRYNTAVLILIFIVGVILLVKQKNLIRVTNQLNANSYFKIILVWFVAPYLIMFLASYKYPMFIDRYILYTSIPFYITVAILINHLYERPFFLKLAIMVFLLGQVYTIEINPNNNRRIKDVVTITKALQSSSSTTLIAPDYAFMGFCYYYNRDYFKQGHNALNMLNQDRIYAVKSLDSANNLLENRKNKKAPLVYVQAGSEFCDPNNEIFKLISNQYKNHKIFHVFEIYDIHYFTN
jgi:mannosyltransferase